MEEKTLTHKLFLQQKYFDLIQKGLKTIELRLNDEKRKKIKVGDLIYFHPNDEKENILNVKVIKIHKSKTFEELILKIDKKDAGFDSDEELVKTMVEFYSIDRQRENGVLGIEVRVL